MRKKTINILISLTILSGLTINCDSYQGYKSIDIRWQAVVAQERCEMVINFFKDTKE